MTSMQQLARDLEDRAKYSRKKFKKLKKIKALALKAGLIEKIKGMNMEDLSGHFFTDFSIPSINYLSPKLYKFFIGLLSDQRLKFSIIAKLCGKDNVVFDLPCGMGDLLAYLDPSCKYYGWDLNNYYIDFCCRKYNGLERAKFSVSNIFFDNLYPDVDVIVLCDILHHVYPNHLELVDKCLKHAKKRVIIAEPTSVNLEDMKPVSQIVSWFFRNWFGKWPVWILKLFDMIMGDFDGINGSTNFESWSFTESQFIKFYKSLEKYGAVLTKLYALDDNIIGVFDKGPDIKPTKTIPHLKRFNGDELWLLRIGIKRPGKRLPNKNRCRKRSKYKRR
ncbi:MAG: class I SAM-dependent methyltransferase [Promethearchaeota archaeon]